MVLLKNWKNSSGGKDCRMVGFTSRSGEVLLLWTGPQTISTNRPIPRRIAPFLLGSKAILDSFNLTHLWTHFSSSQSTAHYAAGNIGLLTIIWRHHFTADSGNLINYNPGTSGHWDWAPLVSLAIKGKAFIISLLQVNKHLNVPRSVGRSHPSTELQGLASVSVFREIHVPIPLQELLLSRQFPVWSIRLDCAGCSLLVELRSRLVRDSCPHVLQQPTLR